jgi:hypothetical protein
MQRFTDGGRKYRWRLASCLWAGALVLCALAFSLRLPLATTSATTSNAISNVPYNRAWSSLAAGPVQMPLADFVQQQKLTASDGGPGNYFGDAVALNQTGDIALVGAYCYIGQGAAYIYTKSGGVWTEKQKLVASDTSSNDGFGRAVALSSTGDVALVGTMNKDAVYVFTRSGDSWYEQQKLTASDATSGDWFGIAVDLNSAGDLALIGAPRKDGAKGAIYVFAKNGGSWSQQQKLLASDGAADDGFGVSLGLNSTGDLALVGAFNKDNGNGASYVFVKSNDTWSQAQKLTASDTEIYEGFGSSVSLNSVGDVALIGAFKKNVGRGAAYIFVKDAGGWTEQQKLLSLDGAGGDQFGVSVALNAIGDTALIGAYAKDSSTGAAYIFVKGASNWGEQQKLLPSDSASNDGFGGAVALDGSGNLALIGALYKASLKGAAYVFDLQTQPASLTLTASVPNPSGIGQSVTFTATVAPLSAPGVVTFKDGLSTLGTVALSGGKAVYTTTALVTVGDHTIRASYDGTPNYDPATSNTIVQTVSPYVVWRSEDNGQGDTEGTLSYSLKQSQTATLPVTILLGRGGSTTLTFTGSLGFDVPPGVTLDGGTCGASPQIVLNGSGVAGDGLRLRGDNLLRNLWVKGFVGGQLVTLTQGNQLQCVKVTE